MSAVPVLGYLGGLFTFGFIWWLLNGIRQDMETVSETGTLFDLLIYFWYGIIIIYLVFGGIWLVRKYNEQQYQGGMF